MAIAPMKQITVCGLKSQRTKLLSDLQRMGCVQLVSSLPNETSRSSENAKKQAFYEKSAQEATAALTVTAEFGAPKASMFAVLEGRKQLTAQEEKAYLAKKDETADLVKEILARNRALTDAKTDIIRLTNQIAALQAWLPLPVATGFEGTATTAAFIGTMPGTLTEESVKALLAEKLPELEAFEVQLVFARPDGSGIFLLCRKPDSAAVEQALRAAGFMRVAAPSDKTPDQEIAALQQKIKQDEFAIARCTEILKKAAQKGDELRFYIDFCTARSEEYAARAELWESKYAFFLTGYLPEKEAQQVEKAISRKFTAAVEIEDPAEDCDVPVLLKNNGFTAPVESVVEAYSMPAKSELDPSFIMSLFYYILFGLMLSDAGYGLLMVLACGICLAKFKNMEPSLKSSLQMFLYCGISTTFWGILQGSFFGDIVGVVASTFFNSSFSLGPVWFAPLDDPMRMLLFALLIGIIHLFTGLAMNMAQHFKNREYRDALYDCVFWYMLVGGLIVLLMTSTLFADMAGFRLALSATGMTVLKAVIFGGMIGIILTAGRDTKNWVVRILKGVYGLYDITGYLSDILSYSRLLALGLATGVIGTVINKMASMAAAPLGMFGIVVFILIFLLGHTINIGINLLGAYVHTNRLQFVEFFGKFYNGGGKKFEPFAANTKYYKLSKEDV